MNSPNDNNFKAQLDKLSLNDSVDDYVKSINIGKNKQNNSKENANFNQDKNNNNINNKNAKRDSNAIINENLHDRSLELEEGIEKKD